MRTVTAMELRAKLGEILDAASAGERIVIERDHRPIAVLVSPEEVERLIDREEERLRQIDESFAAFEAGSIEFARKYPSGPDTPDAATAIRLERDRDLIEPDNDG